MKPSKTFIDAEEGLALLPSARTTTGRGRGLIVAVAAAAFVLGALAATTTTGERLPGAALAIDASMISTSSMHCTSADSYCPCRVTSKTVHVAEPYTCGHDSHNTETIIFHPTDTSKKYPVVYFQRGSSGYHEHEAGYKEWLSRVAGQCLIVIAPNTASAKMDEKSSYRPGCFQDKDLKLAYDATKSNTVLPHLGPIHGSMDLSSVGLMGHSSGAHHLPSLQKHWTIPNVKAMVISHGDKDLLPDDNTVNWWPAEHNIPTMFITSSGDELVPRADVYKAYQENLGKSSIGYHTIFASTTGEHMAPVEADKPASNFGAWTGRFLACHLGGSPTAKVCDRLYGDGADNICNDPNLSPIAYDKNGNALLPSCERQ